MMRQHLDPAVLEWNNRWCGYLSLDYSGIPTYHIVWQGSRRLAGRLLD